MSNDVRPDINNLLANLAQTFRLKASLHLQKANEAKSAYGMPESYYVRDACLAEAREEIERAKRWEAREAEAKRGYFLARQEDLNDHEFMREFGGDMTACQNQGRCVYEATIQDQQIQQMGHQSEPV